MRDQGCSGRAIENCSQSILLKIVDGDLYDGGMKLGTFILAALCAATPAFAEHQTLIQQYQRAYGDQGDPHLLVMIANEYRTQGDAKDALAYYCSYIFTAPAGDDADYASQQAHLLKPGAASDHDACTTQPAVARSADIVVEDALPPPPPRISKREIAGIAMVGVALASFGVGLYEAKESAHYQSMLDAIDPRPPHPSNYKSLQSDAIRSQTAEKWLLASGAAALVVGGVMYLAGRHDRIEAGQVVVAPTVHKRGGGVSVTGAF
jgi:hypothetical protein